MASFWEKLGDAFDQPVGSNINALVQMILAERAEDDFNREREASEAESAERQRQLLNTLFGGERGDLLGVTFEDAKRPYSIPAEGGGAGRGGSLPIGGRPVYEESQPLLGDLSGFGSKLKGMYQSGEFDPEMIMQFMGMGDIQAQPEVPETVNQQELGSVVAMMMDAGMLPNAVLGAGEKMGVDYSQEVPFVTDIGNKEILDLLYPAEEPAPELPLEQMTYRREVMRDSFIDPNEWTHIMSMATDDPDLWGDTARWAETMPSQAPPAERDIRQVGEGGATFLDLISGESVEVPPIDQGPDTSNIGNYGNFSGIQLFYENEDGTTSQIDMPMSNALADTFNSASNALKAIGVTGMNQVGAYYDREARTLEGEPLGYTSTHAEGNSLDVKGFHDAQGNYHPVSDINDPFVQRVMGILEQFPDFVNEGPVWHVGIGAGGRRVNISAPDEVEPETPAQDEIDRWWSDLSVSNPEQFRDYQFKYAIEGISDVRVKELAYQDAHPTVSQSDPDEVSKAQEIFGLLLAGDGALDVMPGWWESVIASDPDKASRIFDLANKLWQRAIGEI